MAEPRLLTLAKQRLPNVGIFCTADGTAVPYRCPGWKHTRISPHPYAQSFRKVRRRGRFCDWRYRSLHVRKNRWQRQFAVIVDFDRMGRDERRRLLSRVNCASYSDAISAAWDIFREQLRKEYGDLALFLTSRSKQAKAIFVIEYPYRVSLPKYKDVIKLISQLFSKHIDLIDLSKSALSHTFVLDEEWDYLRTNLPLLKPIKVLPGGYLYDPDNQEQKVQIADSNFTYYMSDSLPSELGECAYSLKGRMLRLLLCMGRLGDKCGYDISQKLVARSLGCSTRMAGYLLRWAINSGHLETVDSKYIWHQKAKTYRATGKLRKIIRKEMRRRAKTAELPTEIESGQWHSVMMTVLTKYFPHNHQAFLTWVRSIHGWRKGDRFAQAQNMVKWLRTKQAGSRKSSFT